MDAIATAQAAAPHDVFLSYKREDESRAARMAQALTESGLRVWWDRGLPGGESWHTNIENALDGAPCTVVLWSHGSVGPEGNYVRDEARRASVRNRLVPVMIDHVEPPLGLGELQCYDLTRWRGSVRDASFQDLVAAVRAKIAGQPVPQAKAVGLRWRRRFMAGSIATSLASAIAIFSLDAFAVREHLCSLPVGQPAVSDACGQLGWGHRPTRDERLAWGSRPAGNCNALREHVLRFPEGAYRSMAADLIAAAKTERGEPRLETRPVAGALRAPEVGLPSRALAERETLRLVEQQAREETCVLAQTELQDLKVDVKAYLCRPAIAGGIACAADYVAQCTVRVPVWRERCG